MNAPGVQKAQGYISQILKLPDSIPGTLLPSILQLATGAGVSTVTMWKAVGLLRDQGLLEVVKGQGVRIPGNSEPIVVSTSRKSKAIYVKEKIYRDIINGFYEAGALLPAGKDLCSRYGTSNQVLRTAIELLINDSILVPVGRKFRVRTISSGSRFASIVVLHRGETDLEDWTPWGHEFLRTMEKTCSQAGLNLINYRYVKNSSHIQIIDKNGKHVNQMTSDSALLGVVVRSMCQDDLHEMVVEKIADLTCPIAITDEGGCLTGMRKKRVLHNCCIFSVTAGINAGRQIGQFLLESGCRDAAFISPFHSQVWSQNRCNGLKLAFTEAGLGDRVRVLTTDIINEIRMTEFIDPKVLKAIISVMKLKELSEKQMNRLRYSLRDVVENQHVSSALFPLFEEALADNKITAWVCSNDSVAVNAKEFLQSSKMSRSIKVIGFDDSFDAYMNNITSYNFNIPAVVQNLISFFTNPSDCHRSTQNGAIAVNGIIVKR